MDSLNENLFYSDQRNINQFTQVRNMEAYMSQDNNVITEKSISNEEDDLQTKGGQISKKQKWTEEEDKLLIEAVKKYTTNNWPLIACSISGRTGKQCRERWINQLNPDLKKNDWNAQEDLLLINLQKVYGNSWAKISKSLPGRSANAIKNRWSWLSRHRINHSIQEPYLFPFQNHFSQTRATFNSPFNQMEQPLVVPNPVFPLSEPNFEFSHNSFQSSFNSNDENFDGSLSFNEFSDNNFYDEQY